MGERVDIKRPDGKTCPAYLAAADGKPRAAIVVIQEWWGLNRQIQGIADRLAREGFEALVPDLYRGKLASDADEASHLMSTLDFIDAAEQDVRGAVLYLKSRGHAKVAVGGFCMGGALTILCAVKVPEMDAGVCFYGIPPAEAADPAAIRIPLLCHFASRDDWCTPASVDALERKLKAGSVAYELHRYDAAHAFMNETRPEVYDAACATLAWQRTIAFLSKR